jgi:hypothetical protein
MSTHEDPNWPASDAGIPLRTKFRLWTAAIVADQGRQAEDKAVTAATVATDEPGHEYPPRPPAGMDADTGYDPLPSA